MPHFKIIPADRSQPPVEVTALSGSAVLNVVNRLNCGEAAVLMDGAYCFSIRLSREGLWTIFNRNQSRDAAEASNTKESFALFAPGALA